MGKKKHPEVGPYELRFGKDPDGEEGWRVYEDGEPYDWRDSYDDMDGAEERANELWAETLREEITNNLPDDVDELQAILRLINGD